MSTLIQQRGNWVTREQLMMVLWNTDEFITDATLSVHISRLRNKLNELAKGKDIIKTKKGVGYYIDQIFKGTKKVIDHRDYVTIVY